MREAGPEPVTIGGWVDKGTALLEQKGVPEARASAEFLMAGVLKAGRGAVAVRAREKLGPKQSHHFWNLVKDRSRRIPLAYILGSQPFYGLDIAVGPESLIPRPETEELVEEAEKKLRELKRPDLQILEIGTGTGCISIALASLFPDAMIHATDLAPEVLALAQRNALKHHVDRRIRFVREDLHKPASHSRGWADMVVSNPPYIPSAEIAKLEPEVLKEPYLALDGGKDGLSALRAIVADAPRHLKPGGWLVLEIGHDQGPALLRLLEAAGFQDRAIKKDAQGRDRIAVGRKP